MSEATKIMELHTKLLPEGFSLRMLIAGMLAPVPLIAEAMATGTVSPEPLLIALGGWTLWFQGVKRLVELKHDLERANRDYVVSKQQLDEATRQAIPRRSLRTSIDEQVEMTSGRNLKEAAEWHEGVGKRIRRAFTMLNVVEIAAMVICCSATTVLLGPVAALIATQVAWATTVGPEWQSFVSAHWPGLTYTALFCAELLSVNPPPVAYPDAPSFNATKLSQ